MKNYKLYSISKNTPKAKKIQKLYRITYMKLASFKEFTL